MVNTKFLSLKTLNALDEVKLTPVMKVAIKDTLLQIPEDSWQYFGNREMTYPAAITAMKVLNREAGYKAYVVKTDDVKKTFTIYHISKRTLRKALEGSDGCIRIL